MSRAIILASVCLESMTEGCFLRVGAQIESCRYFSRTCGLFSWETSTRLKEYFICEDLVSGIPFCSNLKWSIAVVAGTVLWQAAGYLEFAHPLVKVVLLKRTREPRSQIAQAGPWPFCFQYLMWTGTVLACACCGKIVSMLSTKGVDVN